jgi:hypothetical protein
MTTEISTLERLVSYTNSHGETYTIEDKKFVSRKPKGFRSDFDGALACNHRNKSVCDACIAIYANIIDVMGECFWVRNYAEWSEFVSQVAEMDAQFASETL